MREHQYPDPGRRRPYEIQRLYHAEYHADEQQYRVYGSEGRHSSYNDIENAFKLFICLTTNNDQVIGTVALKKGDDSIAELKALYLDKRYRGQGWGKLLFNAIIEKARTCGFKTIVLDSMKQYKEARKLYEKCGFTDCARYNDNAYAAVFMKLELKKES